jgi:hypothetical protein
MDDAVQLLIGDPVATMGVYLCEVAHGLFCVFYSLSFDEVGDAVVSSSGSSTKGLRNLQTDGLPASTSRQKSLQS